MKRLGKMRKMGKAPRLLGGRTRRRFGYRR